MEPKPPAAAAAAASGPATPRFRLGKQSSLAPERGGEGGGGGDAGSAEGSAVANGVMSFQLMYLAHEGNAEGIRDLLDGGADPNFRDSDGRTALHIAACEGHADVVELLLQRGAEVVVEDQWGSTNHDVIKILEKHGSKHNKAD
nr:unnamed protein product [Digitaria exilis]